MRAFKYPPVDEKARIYDNTGCYISDDVAFFMDCPDYVYHGYRRINGVVWHFFDYSYGANVE